MYDVMILKFLKNLGYPLYSLYRQNSIGVNHLLVTRDTLQGIISTVLFDQNCIFKIRDNKYCLLSPRVKSNIDVLLILSLMVNPFIGYLRIKKN